MEQQLGWAKAADSGNTTRNVIIIMNSDLERADSAGFTNPF